MTKKNKGFSLLELSIVILMIGIIITFIAFTVNLISQAHIRRLIDEINGYALKTEMFHNKYNGFPGDYNLAFNNWGVQCATQASDCNGNGNNLIDWSNKTGGIENLMGWKHLNLSGLLEGNYTGIATVSGQSDLGINIPRSSWNEAGVEFYTGATTISGSTGFGIQIAGSSPNNPANNANVFTKTEAISLDLKIDDGDPYGGSLRVIGPCITGNTPDEKTCFVRYTFY